MYLSSWMEGKYRLRYLTSTCKYYLLVYENKLCKKASFYIHRMGNLNCASEKSSGKKHDTSKFPENKQLLEGCIQDEEVSIYKLHNQHHENLFRNIFHIFRLIFNSNCTIMLQKFWTICPVSEIYQFCYKPTKLDLKGHFTWISIQN